MRALQCRGNNSIELPLKHGIKRRATQWACVRACFVSHDGVFAIWRREAHMLSLLPLCSFFICVVLSWEYNKLCVCVCFVATQGCLLACIEVVPVGRVTTYLVGFDQKLECWYILTSSSHFYITSNNINVEYDLCHAKWRIQSIEKQNDMYFKIIWEPRYLLGVLWRGYWQHTIWKILLRLNLFLPVKILKNRIS